jgi:nucleoside phosphorylase
MVCAALRHRTPARSRPIGARHDRVEPTPKRVPSGAHALSTQSTFARRDHTIREMRVSHPLPSVPVDILILAAHAPEFVGLRPHLGEGLNGVVRGLNLVAKTIGVGMAVSGAGTANRIHQLNPRAVVLLGSCGVYPSSVEYRPLDMVVPSRCHLFDATVAAGKAEFPEPMQTVLDPHSLMGAGLCASAGPRGRQAPVATTLAINVDDTIARAVQPATGIEAENLELFPVALACLAANLPFAAVLGVTNVVGSQGRVDWRQYQRDAAVAAAEVIITWVQNGAQGLPHRASMKPSPPT